MFNSQQGWNQIILLQLTIISQLKSNDRKKVLKIIMMLCGSNKESKYLTSKAAYTVVAKVENKCHSYGSLFLTFAFMKAQISQRSFLMYCGTVLGIAWGGGGGDILLWFGLRSNTEPPKQTINALCRRITVQECQWLSR